MCKARTVGNCIIFLAIVLAIALALPACAQQSVESDANGANATDSRDEISKDPKLVMTQEMASAEQCVRELVNGYENKVAVVVQPLNDDLGFSINGDISFTSASLIKLLILVEYLNEVDSGILESDAVYVRNSKDVVGGTGVIQSATANAQYTYDDLARYMIMYSDNTATNVLIDLMGAENINNEAKRLGLASTYLNRRMMQLNTGVENYISANDATFILREIARHAISSQTAATKAEDYLKSQTDMEGLIEGLPQNVIFGHKTGTLDSVRHDAGIVYSEHPYVITVLTALSATEANNLMENISRAVYERIG